MFLLTRQRNQLETTASKYREKRFPLLRMRVIPLSPTRIIRVSGRTASNSFASSARWIIDAFVYNHNIRHQRVSGSCRKSGESPSAEQTLNGRRIHRKLFINRARQPQSRAAFALSFLKFGAAALPVGAASAKMSSRFPADAIRSAQIETIVRVFPVPGAPK